MKKRRGRRIAWVLGIVALTLTVGLPVQFCARYWALQKSGPTISSDELSRAKGSGADLRQGLREKLGSPDRVTSGRARRLSAVPDGSLLVVWEYRWYTIDGLPEKQGLWSELKGMARNLFSHPEDVVRKLVEGPHIRSSFHIFDSETGNRVGRGAGFGLWAKVPEFPFIETGKMDAPRAQKGGVNGGGQVEQSAPSRGS